MWEIDVAKAALAAPTPAAVELLAAQREYADAALRCEEAALPSAYANRAQKADIYRALRDKLATKTESKETV